MSCYVLKGEKTEKEEILTTDFIVPQSHYQLRGQHFRFFAFSETRYLNISLNKQIISKFCEIWIL
jgi:hypothetical protein